MSIVRVIRNYDTIGPLRTTISNLKYISRFPQQFVSFYLQDPSLSGILGIQGGGVWKIPVYDPDRTQHDIQWNPRIVE